MPAPRRAVLTLPQEVREQLDRRLVERGFAGYTELAAWLAENGHAISRSAVYRYGSQLERRIEALRLATQSAEALVAAAPDDTGAVADASLRLAQERIFDVLLAAEGGDLKELSAAAKALAETARASLAVRAERRKVLAEAAGIADKAAKKAGMSPDTVAAIRTAIEGAPA